MRIFSSVGLLFFVGCFDSGSDKLEVPSDTDDNELSEPSSGEPSTDEPSTDEPSTDEPSANEPSSSEPSTNEPASSEPSDTEDPQDETYPSGPYGWDTAMFWDDSTGSGYWTENGSTVENICLPNAAGDTVCLEDIYKNSEYDVIFLDFSTMWCGPCNSAAEGEHEFLEHLRSNGWKPIWLTVLLENTSGSSPSQSDAQQWVQSHGLSSDTVLYDPSGAWYSGASAGYPSVYTIHNSNMLIWNLQAGWIGPNEGYWNDWLNFFSSTNGLLEYCAAQNGAID